MAVLGYLPKLKRSMRLVFAADFLHTFSIRIFLIKSPIKWPSFNIWRQCPSCLRHYNWNWNVLDSSPTCHSAGLFITVTSLSHRQLWTILKESLINPMFIKMFSTIITKPHYIAPGDLLVKIFIMQGLTFVGHGVAKQQFKKNIAPTLFLNIPNKMCS